MLTRVINALRDQQAAAESKLLEGQFADYTEAKVLVERRKTLKRAIETVGEISKLDEDEDE
jgi:hypothetical protein